ncbi:hypothetical protein J2X85_001628 [Microbacterium trichothecenolyticum]|uniref:hypothetical protein n=1 Tax=Microbacterium trichothecenolyticum TaxID=69370 RepID=UPI0028552544|nr:hypothetical protein [Microbacterium trichothecenolyticum]MDR7184605.1 hypothetical protein [Microbacterium trichothecenolyticum]
MTVLDVLDATAATVVHLAGSIPDPDPVQPPGTEGAVTVLAWLKWIGYVVVAGAIVVGGILIAVSFRRGEGHDALPKILWPCVGAVVIGAGASIVAALMGG